MMSLFNALGNSANGQMPSKQQMQNMVNQLQSDPMGFLKNMGYTVPNGINLNDPNSIIQHLMQTNQINGSLLGKAQQALSLFR